MFRNVARRVERAFTVLIFGIRMLRLCGLRLFLRKTVNQIYGRTIFLVTTGQVDAPRPASEFRCTTNLASPDDTKELFRELRHESSEGRYQLLVRKWYHERGLGDCYITRTIDTNEICAVRWVVTPEHVKRLGWEDRFPLAEDEIMFENLYTFERYRREGARTAAAHQVRKMVLQQSFIRNRGYVDETNIPQLKWGEKTGGKVRARVLERHFLFRTTRKTLEQYDPPIPMKAPPDS